MRGAGRSAAVRDVVATVLVAVPHDATPPTASSSATSELARVRQLTVVEAVIVV
jgi:hypothetical protein